MDFPKIKINPKTQQIKVSVDVDLIKLFGVIQSQYNNCFILESLGEEKQERYTIIGFDPEAIIYALDRQLIYQNRENQISVKTVDNPFLELQKICPQNSISKYWSGGLVGFISYEAINLIEPSLNLQTHPDFEYFKFGIFRDGLVYDKMTGELNYVFDSYDRSQLILELIQKSKDFQVDSSVTAEFIEDALDSKTHAEYINYFVEQIKAGNSFQLEVGMKSKYKITGNSFAIYNRLREVNPSPFSYFIQFGDQVLLGASPELLLRIKDKEMQTSPLAGTIKRGKNPEEDLRLARQLLNDFKEVAEHNMLVDMHRNDLGRVAKFGTVKVRELMEIRKFSHVQHISSDVVGILDDDKDMFDAFASIFPGGVVTGAPKIESMKIIDRNESEPRGAYAGAVGQFSFNGNCTFCIPLRSLFIKGEKAYAQTSSGIVYDSKAENEFQEIKNKLEAMRKVLNEFSLK